METWTLVLIGWLVCGVGAYVITQQKGRDDAGSAGVLGFVLGPIGLVMAAMSRPADPTRIGRVCRNCGQVVAQDRERLCDKCGEPF